MTELLEMHLPSLYNQGWHRTC